MTDGSKSRHHKIGRQYRSFDYLIQKLVAVVIVCFLVSEGCVVDVMCIFHSSEIGIGRPVKIKVTLPS